MIICTLLDSEAFLDVFANEVTSAKKSIKLSLYMLAESWGYPMPPSENLLKLLAKAAIDGLDCRAILAIIPKRYALPEFNVGAAEVLQEAGWHIRFMPAERFLHDKLFIFDNDTTIIGSHNLSKTAMMSSYTRQPKPWPAPSRPPAPSPSQTRQEAHHIQRPVMPRTRQSRPTASQKPMAPPNHCRDGTAKW